MPSPAHATFIRRWGWLAALIATLAYMALLRQQGAPLLQWLPAGILTLEMPVTPERAQHWIDALGARGHAMAVLQVQLDYVFLLLYPLAFATALARVAPLAAGVVARACRAGARAVWVAGALDAIENFAMLRMLDGETATPWPQLSTACAAVKFAIVLAALLMLVAGLVAWAFGGRPAAPR